MKKLLQHISLLLLLAAGMIISAHAMIPHHHHFESLTMECADEHQDAHQTHCEFFNDILNDITLTKKQVQNIMPVVICDISFELFESPLFTEETIPFIESKKALDTYQKHSPTRGSPFIA